MRGCQLGRWLEVPVFDMGLFDFECRGSLPLRVLTRVAPITSTHFQGRLFDIPGILEPGKINCSVIVY